MKEVGESILGTFQIDTQEDQPTTDGHVCDQGDTKNVFDRIGDFFFRMVKGVFLFAILKLPKLVWRCVTRVEYLKFLLKYTKSILWALFWITAWVAIVFAAWMAFGWETFVCVWTFIGNLLLRFLTASWSVIYDNFGIIWMMIALMGSIYGLVCVTLKKRRPRGKVDVKEEPTDGKK